MQVCDRSPRRFTTPRSAYIHVPFCRHRCGYCNFTLVAGRNDLVGRYLAALDRELSQIDAPPPLDTLFCGGGTPTLLAPQQLTELLAILHRRFRLADGCEFTVEANPLDVTPERIDVLRQGGVNRISLGVQSFQEPWLALLERDHRRPEITRAIELALDQFVSVSLDLIYGVPGQSLPDWRADLEAAIEHAPHHLSIYGLTFERGTSFWSRLRRGELQACPEEREREMYELALDLLPAAGYQQYEVASFARPGFACRHNAVYWSGGTYFAAGPGAARHIDGRRETNHRSTTTYLSRVLNGESPVAESEFLSPPEAARERFVIGMRQLTGIEIPEFTADVGFGLPELFGDKIDRFLEMGLLESSGNRLCLTRDGLLISDAMWTELLHPAGSH